MKNYVLRAFRGWAALILFLYLVGQYVYVLVKQPDWYFETCISYIFRGSLFLCYVTLVLLAVSLLSYAITQLIATSIHAVQFVRFLMFGKKFKEYLADVSGNKTESYYRGAKDMKADILLYLHKKGLLDEATLKEIKNLELS